MKWLKWIGAAVLAILAAIVGSKSAGRKSDRDKAHESKADELNKGISKDLEDAKDKIEESGEAIDEGKAAENAMNKELEKPSEPDQNVRDTTLRLNKRTKRRVRKRPKGKRS